MLTFSTTDRPVSDRDEPEFVTMKNGMVVSIDALRLLWRLEEAEMVVRAGGGRLQVGPRRRLTAADDAAIRVHRDELVALVEMCEAM